MAVSLTSSCKCNIVDKWNRIVWYQDISSFSVNRIGLTGTIINRNGQRIKYTFQVRVRQVTHFFLLWSTLPAIDLRGIIINFLFIRRRITFVHMFYSTASLLLTSVWNQHLNLGEAAFWHSVSQFLSSQPSWSSSIFYQKYSSSSELCHDFLLLS